jgi:uncharacterized protein
VLDASDLDLVLRHPQDLSQDVQGVSALREALQARHLPILVDVHLWSRLPVGFHAQIEQAYVEIQSA